MKRLKHILKQLLSRFVYRCLMFGLPTNPSLEKKNAESSIAVVCLGALGDFILFCSIARELYHAGSRLILICRKELGIEEFAALTGYFDRVIALPHQLSRRPGNLRLLKKVKVGSVIVAPAERHIYSDLCVLALQGSRRILPDTLQGCSLPSLKRIVDQHVDVLVPVEERYELERYERYLHGAEFYSGQMEYYTFEWVEANLSERKRQIAIFPGAGGGGIKQWPVERFAYVAQNLCDETKSEVLICGTKGEESLIQTFCRLMPDNICCVRGSTELFELLQQLRECSLAIVNDSGSAYLAISCGVPTIVICGCWEYGRFYPGARLPINCSALIASLDNIKCAPCWKSKPDCIKNGAAPCVLAVEQEAVLSIAQAYLKNNI